MLFRRLEPVFVIFSMTQYVENFNLQIPHDHTCRRSLKIQSRSLNLYFRTGRSSPCNFYFVGLVSSKPIKEGKRTSYRDVNVNKTVKSSKSLRLNFYVVLQPTTRSSRSQMFFKIGVLQHFIKFTGKYLRQSLFFNKVAGLRTATLLKKRLWHECFSNTCGCCFCTTLPNMNELKGISHRFFTIGSRIVVMRNSSLSG